MPWPTIHGFARTPTYNAWSLMKNRCKPSNKDAKNYAERGISYDPAWESFEAFLRDMGERPPGMSLDRKNNDEGYSKGNCRWATPQQQAENKRGVHRIQWAEKTFTLAALAKEVGVNVKTLEYRLRTGMPLEQAIAAPRRSFKRGSV